MSQTQQMLRLQHMAAQHPNVVPIILILEGLHSAYAVFESFPEGDLFDCITEKGHYIGNDTLIKKVFVQILDAVHHGHTLGIYHFNTKPESIYVTDQGMTLKLSGFELATTDPYSMEFNYKRDFYVSPESLSSDPEPEAYASVPHDIWGLGVTLVNLISGRNPWKLASMEDPLYQDYVKDPQYLKTILPLSDDVMPILNRIFESDPKERITIPELRDLILGCPCLSTSPPPPPLPPLSLDPLRAAVDALDSPKDGDVTGSEHNLDQASKT